MILEGPRREQRQALSALMDGDEALLDEACKAWHDDADARADWHTYHLIGDLMRSDDTPCSPQHDARFLAGVRQRLAVQPVVVAPTATGGRQPDDRRRRAWLVPMAAAAGFVVVAGVLVVTRVAAPDAAESNRAAQMANSTTGVTVGEPSLVAGAVPLAPMQPASQGAQGGLVRSAELDRYLAAHKQYTNTSTLAVPGGSVRNAAAAGR